MTYPTGDAPERGTRDRWIDREGIAGVGWGWFLAAILAIVIVLLIGWWLWWGGDGPIETRSMSLGAILEEEELVDDRVVVSGRVERVLTENAMTLGNDFVDGELLVLTPGSALVGPGGGAVAPDIAVPADEDGTVSPFLEGQFVQITGIVRTFDAGTMSEEYALVLAPELIEPYEGEPSIITEVFDIAMRALLLGAPVEEEVDVASVLAEPERYAGQAVRLEGRLGEVVSDIIFTLTGPDGEGGLLVVGEDTGQFDEVEPGRPIRAEGTVLSFDVEALERAGVELGEVDLASLEGRPTVIPTAMEVLDPKAETSPATDGPAEVTPQAS